MPDRSGFLAVLLISFPAPAVRVAMFGPVPLFLVSAGGEPGVAALGSRYGSEQMGQQTQPAADSARPLLCCSTHRRAEPARRGKSVRSRDLCLLSQAAIGCG